MISECKGFGAAIQLTRRRLVDQGLVRRRAILDALVSGPLTIKEIAAAMGCDASAVRSQMPRLLRCGAVVVVRGHSGASPPRAAFYGLPAP